MSNKVRDFWGWIVSLPYIKPVFYIISLIIFLLIVSVSTIHFIAKYGFLETIIFKYCYDNNIEYEKIEIETELLKGLSFKIDKIKIRKDLFARPASLESFEFKLNILSFLLGDHLFKDIRILKPTLKFDLKKFASKNDKAATDENRFQLNKIIKNIFLITNYFDTNSIYLNNLNVELLDSKNPINTIFFDDFDLVYIFTDDSSYMQISGSLVNNNSYIPISIFTSFKEPTLFSDNLIITNINLGNTDLRGWKKFLSGKAKFFNNDIILSSTDIKIIIGSSNSVDLIGTIALEKLTINDRSFYKSDKEISDSNIRFYINLTDQLVNVSNLILTNKDFSLLSSGKIINPYSRNRYFDFELSSSKLDISLIKYFIPDGKIPADTIYYIKDGIKTGSLRITDLRYRAASDQKLNLKDGNDLFKAFVEIENISVKDKMLPSMLTGIAGKLVVDKNFVVIKDSKGRYRNSNIDSITVKVADITDKDSDLDIDLNIQADLKDLIDLAGRIAGAAKIEDVTKHIEKLDGNINLNFNASRNKSVNDGKLALIGKLLLDDLYIKTALLPFDIESANGYITASSSSLVFNDFNFKVKNNQISINGALYDFTSNKPVLNLDVESALSVKDLSMIAKMAPKDKRSVKPEGSIALKALVNGIPRNLFIDLDLDLTDAKYQFFEVLRKTDFSKNHLTAKANLKDYKILDISDLNLALGEKTSAKGSIKFVKNPKSELDMELKVESDYINPDDIDNNFSFFDNIDSNGMIYGSFYMKKKPNQKPILDGFIASKNAKFKIPVINSAFENLDAMIKFKNDRSDITKANGKLSKGIIDLTGSGVFSNPKKFHLDIDTSNLSLDDVLTGKEDSSADETLSSELARRYPIKKSDSSDGKDGIFDGSWNIDIDSAEGFIDFFPYKNLHLELLFDNDIFVITPFVFDSLNGSFVAPITVKKRKDNLTSITGKLIGYNISPALFVSLLNDDSYFSDQTSLNIKADFTTVGKNSDDFKRSLSGAADISTSPGVINRFYLLSRIFSIISLKSLLNPKNLPDMEKGLYFNNMSSKLYIHEGKISTDQFLISSDSINISASGYYDISKKFSDFNINISPFASFEDGIRAIPLIGYLLLGENGTLVSIPFKAEGYSDDIDIKPNFLSGYSSNLIGILERLFLR